MMMDGEAFLEQFAGTEGAEALAAIAVVLGVIGAIAGAIGLALYLLRAIGVYKMAKTAGITKAWLAFIPIVNVFPFGKLAEKTVKRDGTKPAKFGMILLILKCAILILGTIAAVVGTVFIFRVVAASIGFALVTEEETKAIFAYLIWLAPLSIILSGLGIAKVILHYIALYRIFTAFHYENATLYTALSVAGMLFLSDILEPIFLFAVRNRQPVFDYRDRLNAFTQNL